jgi:Nucleotidyl transferase AbiEii toxin, Type IV TA system
MTLVDLVADPVPLAEPPVEVDLGGARIWVDTPYQILVNKLCALLSRSELRDIEDVQALVGTGLDLRRALTDAPAQDGGFSPLTFAWVLRQLPIEAMATAMFARTLGGADRPGRSRTSNYGGSHEEEA